MGFTHLQIRSGYSLYNSTIKIEPLVKQAQQLGYDALALTDEGVLYGAIPFYEACQKYRMKPIFGLALTVNLADESYDCLIIAKSNAGYKQLIHISTQYEAYEKRSFESLFTETNELICVVHTKTKIVETLLQDERFDELKETLQPFMEKFSEFDFYLGLEQIEALDHLLLNKARVFSDMTNISAVALHDVRYLSEKDELSYDCLQAMKKGHAWDGLSVNKINQGRHLRSKAEMKEAFQDWVEPLSNTETIKNKCNVTFSFDDMHLPTFPVPEGETSQSYLKKLCYEQIKVKYDAKNQRAYDRLAYELKVINNLQFNDYFLVVADFVQYAKDNGIAVGPGRGSAAGSIVAYLLGITDVDPLQYNLLFERFLNPERVTMPDIDIDFSDKRRDEVIEYVREKYGVEYVAQIITFGTFAARSILREVMKVMDVAESDQTYILRHIPTQSQQTIAESIKEEKELVKYIKQSKKLTMLFAIAIKLEGLPRHISTHAAGIVIGKRPLIHDVPLTKGTHGTFVTQYAMNELEKIGLLKMDILGLKNLTLIERIVYSIRKNVEENFSLSTIPENDETTFRMLAKGQTNGVFQFESSGMRAMLMKVKPTSLDDLIALNALYRPGPMEHISTYTKRKHGIEKVTYLHPDLEPILKETYGVLIYQEQIMQIVNRFASFSLGEADLLRRAISAKSKTEMEAQRERFIKGCLENGYERAIAEELFRWIVTFANYGFNKSHSVAYSKIAYILAYLKVNFPAYFFAQLLSSSIGDDGNKRISYIRDANEFGINILPPSINRSFAYYTVEDHAIRMGLMAIKGIGYETVKAIVDERKKGPFKDLFDFTLRVKIKRNALETLILAGSFDETYSNRASLLASITPALERAELFGDYGDGNLFKDSLDMKPNYVTIEDFPLMKKLNDEKELLLTYISHHPLKEKRLTLSLENFQSIAQIKKLPSDTYCKLIAYANRINKIRTKRGDSMAFVSLSDETDELETVIFPNVYREVSPVLEEEGLYRIEGKVSERNGEKQVIINRLEPISLQQIEVRSNGQIYIRLDANSNITYNNALSFLADVAREFSGKTKVIVYDERQKKAFKLSDKYSLKYEKNSSEKLISFFGNKNVVFKS